MTIERKSDQSTSAGNSHKSRASEKINVSFQNVNNGMARFSVVYNSRGRIADFVVLDVNKAWEKLFGRKRSEVVGNRVNTLFDKIDFRWFLIAEHVLKDKTGRTIEYHFEVTDQWFQVVIYSSTAKGCVLLFIDITAMKKEHKLLQHNENRMRALLEGSSDMVQVLDERGAIQYVSPSMKRILGYDASEPMGDSVFKIVHPDDMAEAQKKFAEVLACPHKPAKVVCRCLHKNGTWRYVEAWATNHLANPAIRGIILNIRDISEHIQAQMLVRESEEKFRKIVEQSHDGITIIDDTGTILVFNAAQERISGILASEAIGNKMWSIQYRLLTEQSRKKNTLADMKKKLQQMFKAGKSPWLENVFEVEMARPDGTYVYLQNVVFPIRLNTGVLYVSFNRDVTELRRAHEELEEQNRLLQEKNITLHELMNQLQLEKKRIGDQVISNVDRIVLPLISKAKTTHSNGVMPYLNLLEENLKEITSSFGNHLVRDFNTLTQKEVEICGMIKRGITCKEIGNLLSISHRTVETHRNRIRRKLGISDPAVNLATFLNNIS
ncbi:MAG: PAS domain S-box protein [Chitinivibrionales bacterium]